MCQNDSTKIKHIYKESENKVYWLDHRISLKSANNWHKWYGVKYSSLLHTRLLDYGHCLFDQT